MTSLDMYKGAVAHGVPKKKIVSDFFFVVFICFYMCLQAKSQV